MANPLPKVESSGGPAAMAQLMSVFGSMFGTGTTKSSQTSSVDPKAAGQADELLARILGGTDSEELDAMVANILTRAKQEFGPQLIASKGAGMRTYSDTTLRSQQNEAMARATGEAAKARLDAINQANRTAAGLVESRMTNTRSIQQQSKTGASPAGKGSALLLGGAQLYSKLRKTKAGQTFEDEIKGMFGTDQASVGDFSSGGGFDAADFDSIYSSPAGDTSTLDAGSIGLEGFGDSQTIEMIEGQEDVFDPADITDPNTITAAVGAGGVAISAPDVVTGLPMPPAPLIDPTTGEIIPRMPAAVYDPMIFEGIEAAEAAEAAESGIEFVGGIDAGADYATAAGDLLVEGGGEVAGEIGGAALGDIYFPGAFTVFNALSEGQAGEAVGQLVEAGEGAVDLVGGADGSLEDIVSDGADFVTDLVDDIFGGCFMTTAATEGGELDNGYTLNTMRAFRSSYMQQTPERASEVLDYYILAPIVVKRITEKADAARIWEKVRTDYLNPCVAFYHMGMPEETHRVYQEMMYWARQQVGLANPQGAH